jgi:putative endonuclease
MKKWLVYILLCGDNTLYTGVTVDIEKRISAHNKGNGAKYTRARLPVSLVWSENAESEGSAKRREAEIKKLTRRQKLKLIKISKLT